MTDRSATTNWEGGLADGQGRTDFNSSGAGTFDVTWASRTEAPNGKTSPEELLAAAHASCFSMALSKQIGDTGATPQRLETTATVTLEGGSISKVALKVRGSAEGLDESGFKSAAQAAKDGCPVSKLFGGNAEITLDAELS